MARPSTPAHLVIDARPRGPRGPLAGERVLGRSVLAHLLDLALTLDDRQIAIHARLEEHPRLRALVASDDPDRFIFATGPPPEDSTILRTDRLYDPARLQRALRRGRNPESAVIWRLDQPQGIAGAEDELTRRQSYQPIGRYWALGPARLLARLLRPTGVHPNVLTLASAALVLEAAGIVAFAPAVWRVQAATAAALALGLVLDTADGHLARLQGTTSEFGRWLDVTLDELGDMALHAAIAWCAFVRDGHPAWLLLGMLYAMGKYLFVVSTSHRQGPPRSQALLGNAVPDAPRPPCWPEDDAEHRRRHSHAERGNEWIWPLASWLTRSVRLAGHADVRWHLWIVLAALGRLDVALAAYAVYFPLRAIAGAARKAVRHA